MWPLDFPIASHYPSDNGRDSLKTHMGSCHGAGVEVLASLLPMFHWPELSLRHTHLRRVGTTTVTVCLGLRETEFHAKTACHYQDVLDTR